MPEDTFSHVAGSNVFLFLYKRLNCGYSSEATLQGTSNVYIQYTVASHYFKLGVGVGGGGGGVGGGQRVFFHGGTLCICLACMGHAYWSTSSFLPNIIKVYLRVSKLWSTQDFGFRGGTYVMKNVRVVSLACDTTTGLPLHFCKTL